MARLGGLLLPVDLDGDLDGEAFMKNSSRHSLVSSSGALVSSDAPWKSMFVDNSFQQQFTQGIVVIEAFKLLEESFTEAFKVISGMKKYRGVLDKLQPMIMKKCNSLKLGVKTPLLWYQEISFGVFCDCISLLLELEGESEISSVVIRSMIPGLRQVFMSTTEETIETLKEKCKKNDFHIGTEAQACIQFFESSHNFVTLVKEWATLSVLRGDRKSFAYPFPTSTRMAVSKQCEHSLLYLKETLDNTNYTDAFPHVSRLLLLSIEVQKAAQASKEKSLKAKFLALLDDEGENGTESSGDDIQGR